MRRVDEPVEGRAALDMRGSRRSVDGDRVQFGEIDDEAVVNAPESAAVVPAAADSDAEILLGCELVAATTSASSTQYAIAAGCLSIIAL